MKTISELEAELVDLRRYERECWNKVQEQNKVLDALTAPWMAAGCQARKLEVMIETRKEMEAAQ